MGNSLLAGKTNATGYPGQLSLGIHLWVGAMSTADMATAVRKAANSV